MNDIEFELWVKECFELLGVAGVVMKHLAVAEQSLPADCRVATDWMVRFNNVMKNESVPTSIHNCSQGS